MDRCPHSPAAPQEPSARAILAQASADLTRLQSLLSAARAALDAHPAPPALQAVLDHEHRLDAWARRLERLQQQIARDADLRRDALERAEHALRLRARDLAQRQQDLDAIARSLARAAEEIERQRAALAVEHARLKRRRLEPDQPPADAQPPQHPRPR